MTTASNTTRSIDTESLVVIEPNEQVENTTVGVKLTNKRKKNFITSTDSLKQLVETVNQKEDEILQVKRSKEMENEKYLADKLAKFSAKREKKQAILEKYKDRIRQRKQKTESQQREEDSEMKNEPTKRGEYNKKGASNRRGDSSKKEEFKKGISKKYESKGTSGSTKRGTFNKRKEFKKGSK